MSTPGRPLLLSAVRADGDRLLDLVAGDPDGDGDSDGDGDGGLRDEWKLRWATLSSPGDLQTCLTEAGAGLSRGGGAMQLRPSGGVYVPLGCVAGIMAMRYFSEKV